LEFRTTDELPDGPITLGQDRAVSAIQFGIGIRHNGYNLFALGPSNAGGHVIVRQFLEQQAAHEPTARDWCYVHNFEQPHRPRAISPPAGRGVKFRDDMAQLVEDLRTAVSAALETDEYRQRHQQIDQEFNERRQTTLTERGRRAAERGVALIQTHVGFALAPMRDGHPLDADDFAKLPESDRTRLKTAVDEFECQLEKLLHEIPKWRRESREEERALKRAVTSRAVDALIDELSKGYEGHQDVQRYLSLVKRDVIEHADDLRKGKEEEEGASLETLIAKSVLASQPLGRYQVNVLDDNSGVTGARVVYLDQPTFQKLVGRIEHVAEMGTLVTHFTLIKPGALHRANGGYLILDARRLLLHGARIVGDSGKLWLGLDGLSDLLKEANHFAEGDSASSAELYALLSSLADVPLKQAIAVTGAINQRGEVQAVGVINEKIEGFFDVCKARGLTGVEGVLIPSANRRHLMLRRDVIDAVAAGTFHICAMDTVDQGAEILTNMSAGTRDATGRFPAGTFNERVETRLITLAKQARAFKLAAEGTEAVQSARAPE
jgi:hypothetical protein